MKALTDEQTAVVTENKALVSRVINRYFCGYDGRDDLLQEGYIALCDAARSFSRSYSVSFDSFATTCIIRRVWKYLSKRDKWPLPMPMESDFVLSRYGDDNPQQNAQWRETLDVIKVVLTEIEYSVFTAYFVNSETITEISRSRSVSAQYISAVIDRLVDKIRKGVFAWTRR